MCNIDSQISCFIQLGKNLDFQEHQCTVTLSFIRAHDVSRYFFIKKMNWVGVGVVGRRATNEDKVQPRTPYGCLLKKAPSLAHGAGMPAHKCVSASLPITLRLRGPGHFLSRIATYPVASFVISTVQSIFFF